MHRVESMATHCKLQHMVATRDVGAYVNAQGGGYGNALQAAVSIRSRFFIHRIHQLSNVFNLPITTQRLTNPTLLETKSAVTI